MSDRFMDNLYFGIGGEHYVIGDFIMRGYEASKISPDFGYDVHITNKRLVIAEQETESQSFFYK